MLFPSVFIFIFMMVRKTSKKWEPSCEAICSKCQKSKREESGGSKASHERNRTLSPKEKKSSSPFLYITLSINNVFSSPLYSYRLNYHGLPYVSVSASIHFTIYIQLYQI